MFSSGEYQGRSNDAHPEIEPKTNISGNERSNRSLLKFKRPWRVS